MNQIHCWLAFLFLSRLVWLPDWPPLMMWAVAK